MPKFSPTSLRGRLAVLAAGAALLAFAAAPVAAHLQPSSEVVQVDQAGPDTQGETTSDQSGPDEQGETTNDQAGPDEQGAQSGPDQQGDQPGN